MPTITFSGLPLGPWNTFDGLIQNLLFAVLIFLSIQAFLARRRAVLIATQLKDTDDRWKNDSRFHIPWIAPVDPAIHLLWGKTDDLPSELQEAILRWRRLTNRVFLAALVLAAISIWRH